MPNLLVFAILLSIGVFTFIVSNVIWDLFGLKIKDKISKALPQSITTDTGAVHK